MSAFSFHSSLYFLFPEAFPEPRCCKRTSPTVNCVDRWCFFSMERNFWTCSNGTFGWGTGKSLLVMISWFSERRGHMQERKKLWLCFWGLLPSLKPLPPHPDRIFRTRDHSLWPVHIYTHNPAQQDGRLLILLSKWPAASLATVQALEFHLAFYTGRNVWHLNWGGRTVLRSQPEWCKCWPRTREM